MRFVDLKDQKIAPTQIEFDALKKELDKMKAEKAKKDADDSALRLMVSAATAAALAYSM